MKIKRAFSKVRRNERRGPRDEKPEGNFTRETSFVKRDTRGDNQRRSLKKLR